MTHHSISGSACQSSGDWAPMEGPHTISLKTHTRLRLHKHKHTPLPTQTSTQSLPTHLHTHTHTRARVSTPTRCVPKSRSLTRSRKSVFPAVSPAPYRRSYPAPGLNSSLHCLPPSPAALVTKTFADPACLAFSFTSEVTSR